MSVTFSFSFSPIQISHENHKCDNSNVWHNWSLCLLFKRRNWKNAKWRDRKWIVHAWADRISRSIPASRLRCSLRSLFEWYSLIFFLAIDYREWVIWKRKQMSKLKEKRRVKVEGIGWWRRRRLVGWFWRELGVDSRWRTSRCSVASIVHIRYHHSIGIGWRQRALMMI